MQPNAQHKLSARDIHEIYDRRLVPDRRTHPTTFWSALGWHGRRRSFRRAGEGQNTYVDCPAPRTVVLVLMVLCCAALDAWLTLCHLADGGQEANSVMALALAAGPTVFLSITMGAASLGALALAVHQQYMLARKGLHGLTLGYGVLLCYHVILFVYLA